MDPEGQPYPEEPTSSQPDGAHNNFYFSEGTHADPIFPVGGSADSSYENFMHSEHHIPYPVDPILPHIDMFKDAGLSPPTPIGPRSEFMKDYIPKRDRSISMSKVLREFLENDYKLGGSLFSTPEQSQPEQTGPTLDEIGGNEEAKKLIRKFLAAVQNPEKFKRWGAKPPKGLLLYGPPGTGKTMMAKAIAREMNGHFESIKPSDINSKWFGESEQRIKDLFEDARRRDGHTVIFIDEIDSMMPRRDAINSGGVKDSLMTMFLQYMDGKDSPENVTLVGATNRPDAIDPAVLRPGRIDRKIEIGYPDHDGRKAILDVHIAVREKDAERKLFDLDETELGLLLDGADVMTGAQIAEVVRRVCEEKAYESLENDDLGMADVGDLAGGFASLIAEGARYDV